MPEREVRYCTTEDGVRIAYCVEGEGPPVFYVPSFVDSFAQLHYTFARDFFASIAGGRTLVRLDHRGVGLSQRDVPDISIEAHALDVEGVRRELGEPVISLLAATIAGPVALVYAALHPANVSHLVLYETFSNVQELMTDDQLRSFAQLCRTNWHVAAQAFADMSVREQYSDIALAAGKAFEEGTTGEHMARRMELGLDWDGAALLPSITAQTLVLHRKDDPTIPFAAGQKMAAGIPGARLVPLEGAVTYGVLGDIAPVTAAIDAFLPKGEGPLVRPAHAAPSPFRTVLFTDIVGHTEMMQRLGDEKGRVVLREHERITREVLKQHGGHEVKTMGDGFMASFASVTKALECAVALQRSFENYNAGVGAHRDAPLQIRIGLNAGEPIAEEGDLFGATVILAARIAAQAKAGEILIPEPVRHLLAGKEFLFSDRGEAALKGFEDAVRLYEVRWREGSFT